MRFLVDAQLPPGLFGWLALRGHISEHVADLSLAMASDREIWARAKADGAILITKDEDFAVLRQRAQRGPTVC